MINDVFSSLPQEAKARKLDQIQQSSVVAGAQGDGHVDERDIV